MSGWIKLHRELIKWEWYTDHNTCRLFIHCLLRANHTDTKWRGQKLNRGQFLTSLESLSKETGLSISQIRTSLRKLKLTGEIASLSQARSRIITVTQYDSYQEDSKQNSKLVASSSQAGDKLVTTDKNVKKNKNVKKEILIPVGINESAWKEWIDFRKSKNKAVSQAAANKQFKLLLDYHFNVQQQIIDKSISSDYQGLFTPSGGANETNKSGQYQASPKLTPTERVQAKRAEARGRRQSMGSMGGDDQVIPSCLDVERARGADATLDTAIGITYAGTDEQGA